MSWGPLGSPWNSAMGSNGRPLKPWNVAKVWHGSSDWWVGFLEPKNPQGQDLPMEGWVWSCIPLWFFFGPRKISAPGYWGVFGFLGVGGRLTRISPSLKLTASLHLKMDGRLVSFWDVFLACAVSGRVTTGGGRFNTKIMYVYPRKWYKFEDIVFTRVTQVPTRQVW